MKTALIYLQNNHAGTLTEHHRGSSYEFVYKKNYQRPPISLTMPITKTTSHFDTFPPFFDGLLPEGWQLEALLKQKKIDQNDLIQQLITVGSDLIGAITVKKKS